MPHKHTRAWAVAVIAAIAFLFAFVVSGRAMIGDLNLDDLVDRLDLDLIRQGLGLRSTDPGWDPQADLNLDDKIDVFDLAIAGRSYGAERILHSPRQVSNSTRNAIYLDACIDASDRIHAAWSEDKRVYYTRLDRYGNTLVDDLLLDFGDGVGNSGVGIGCDEAGDAQVVWDCQDGLCQARLDQWGYLIMKKAVVDTRGTALDPSIDLDQTGLAHLFYTRWTNNQQVYTVIDPEGRRLLSDEGTAKSASATISRYHDLVVDPSNAVHLIRSEEAGPDRLYYRRYGAGSVPSLPETQIGELGWDGSVTDVHEPSLALDSAGNAFVLYNAQRPTGSILYLEKIGPSGVSLIDDEPIFPEWDVGGYGGAISDLAVDQDDHLHLLSFTGFGGATHTAYGIFSNAAAVLEPMRMVVYDEPMRRARLMLDAGDETQIVYQAGPSSTGYPSCGSSKLCYQGSAFRAAAYDRSLADLGVDVAHLSWEPLVARWSQPLVITGTVFNAGWVASPVADLKIDAAVAAEVLLGPPAQASVEIPALSPRASYNFTATITLPFTPPTGFEEIAYARLLLSVDPADLVPETTEANNQVSVPFVVQVLPTKTGLFLNVRDDTLTARGGQGVWVSSGTAVISGAGYPAKNVPVTQDQSTLAKDLPVGSTPAVYTVSWSGSGYHTPDPATISIVRNGSDPYRIDYAPEPPGNTALLVTDRWGSLSGMITKSDGGDVLPDAKVRVAGQGLAIEVTTDEHGAYSPALEPALAKLIPGDYEIRVSAAGYARQVDSITISALQTATWSQALETTKNAYVHGNVVNDFGNPVAGASVSLCGANLTTDVQGVFDGEVDAGCTTLSASRSGYALYSTSIALTAGLEALFSDLSLEFDPPLNVTGGSGRYASRIIDVSSGDLLPTPPDDANWAQKQIYDKFKDSFWPEYSIKVLYGCYAFNLSAGYSGPSDDRHLSFVQLLMAPRTFEVHALIASIDYEGAPIPIPIVSDSGQTSAIRVIEARLVNTASGEKSAPTRNTIEFGNHWWDALDPAGVIATYDFEGAQIDDWDNTEVWIYYKTGLNQDGSFNSSILLDRYDQHVLKLKLSTGEVTPDYVLSDFPLP